MKAPCYKCTERQHLCHSTCERYRLYAEEREQVRQERDKMQEIKTFYNDTVNHVQADLSRRRKR